MGQRDYAQTAWEVQAEITRLVAKRKAIDERLARLYRRIASLEDPSSKEGWKRQLALKLGDACRFALRGYRTPRTPTQIRDELVAVGFPVERYANALACIHTTLKRLVQNGEAQALKVGGKTGYLATDYLRPPGRLDFYV